MFTIESCTLPEEALLGEHARRGVYTDCFRTELDGIATQAQFVEAFYTTLAFKLERVILKWLVSRPSSDKQARQLATGASDHFAAWRVEKRCTNQLLLSDFRGDTRSWLMVSPGCMQGDRKTLLYFGSAIIPTSNDKSGAVKMGPGYRALLGLHKLYSAVLLGSARSRLAGMIRNGDNRSSTS